MSEITTIARPYAKAVFEHANQVKALEAWSYFLNSIAVMMQDEAVVQFVAHPETTNDQQRALFDDLITEWCAQDSESAKAFVKLLIESKRMTLLPAIAALYETLCQEAKQKVNVTVESFMPLSDKEQEALKEKLAKRLNREVTLSIIIKPELMGGAVIRTNDMVIDGSVIGRLQKLATALAA